MLQIIEMLQIHGLKFPHNVVFHDFSSLKKISSLSIFFINFISILFLLILFNGLSATMKPGPP